MVRSATWITICLLVVALYDQADTKPFADNSLDSETQLVFLQTIWRHGDRTPVFVWPNNPNQGLTWPQGLGQLTDEGLRQHVQLGRKLRQLYEGFISPEYNSREIYVRSSDVNRTILSAVANMIGFFGGANNQNYPHVEGWPHGYQPVPIHTVPQEFDHIRILLKKDCARFSELQQMVESTPEYKELADGSKDLMQKMQLITGSKNLTLKSLSMVADTYRIEKLYNRPETPGLTPEIYDMVEPISRKINAFKHGLGLKPFRGVDLRLESAKLHGGLLLWAMIDHMKQKRDCMEASVMEQTKEDIKHCEWFERLKYYALSAHDSTIASLFDTFGFPKINYKSESYAPYAACVTMELRKNLKTQEYFVRLNYIIEDKVTNITADVVDCTDKLCSLDQFINRSKPYKIEDPKRFCASPLPSLIDS